MNKDTKISLIMMTLFLSISITLAYSFILSSFVYGQVMKMDNMTLGIDAPKNHIDCSVFECAQYYPRGFAICYSNQYNGSYSFKEHIFACDGRFIRTTEDWSE